MASKERVKRLFNGEPIDRPPLYDVIRNDAMIEHFAGKRFTPGNAATVLARVDSRARDATKWWYPHPNFNAGTTYVDEQGRM